MSREFRGLWTMSFGQNAELLRTLENMNITSEDIDYLRRDEEFAGALATFWKTRGIPGEPIPDTRLHAKARRIMGSNFLGLEEVRRGYRIAPPVEQLAMIPFSEKTLRKYRRTHVLVAGASLSINEMRDITNEDFNNVSWYKEEEFAAVKKMDVRWHLIRKKPVPESCYSRYNMQVDTCPKNEQIPLACEMVYMTILYWLTHRRRLLTNVYVHCQDTTLQAKHRVNIGRFTEFGLTVNYGWQDRLKPNLGLASAVRPQKEFLTL